MENYVCATEVHGGEVITYTWRDLDNVLLADAQPHFARVRYHLDHVAVHDLITSLRHERLEARSYFACTQVATGRDEFHPQ